MARESAGTISCIILPLANWIIELKRLDLYNKSRMTGDCHVRFCERPYVCKSTSFCVNS